MAAIIGGFLIMVGIILLGFSALALFGYFETGTLLKNEYLLVFALVMVAVGLFDTLSAIIIARW